MTTDQGTTGGVESELNSLVTPNNQGLNPNANIFQSKLPNSATPPTWNDAVDDGAPAATVIDSSRDYHYINGDVNKLTSETVLPAATPPPGCSTSAAAAAAAAASVVNMSSDYAVNGFAAALGATEAVAYSVASTVSSPTLQDSRSERCPEDTQTTDSTLPIDQLKAMLTQQLEYYFSRENLANDTYLLSQMDSDQYVPIWTVANFNQIKKLTKDLNLIVEVLRESPNVQVDEAGEKVRPNHKRCIVILREIPESTPVEEVEGLFKGESCPKFVSCEFAHNNNWYVTFESDEDAQKAYGYLREEVKTFQGKSIMARIKAKPIARTTYIPKNGFRPVVDTTIYAQQQTPQQPVQQPQPQQQQQQQQQRFLPYAAHVPSIGYNSQQVPVYAFPPFYPPSMLQTWGPTGTAFCDIGSVFTINGLAPQAAFKPINGSGRSSFSARTRNHKGHSRSQSIVDRPEARLLGGQTVPALQNNNLISTVKGARPASVDGGHSKWEGNISDPVVGATAAASIGPTSLQQCRSNVTGSREALSTSVATVAAVATVPSVTTEKREDTTQTMTSALYNKQSDAQASQGAQPPRSRHRRKKKDDDPSVLRPRQEPIKSSIPTKESKVLPKFDLEAASFPPLPGTIDRSAIESEVFESRISDVVRGTAKPSTRDTKTQTSAPLSPVSLPPTKESSTLTNGDALTSVFSSPPPSPTTSRCTRSVTMADKSTKTDEFLIARHEAYEPVDLPSSVEHHPLPPSTRPNVAIGASEMPSAVIEDVKTTTCSSHATNSLLGTTIVTLNKPVTVNSISVSEGREGQVARDAKPVKLSYAQMAQRAKEKVEKIAQEQKEKQEVQERERRVRERELATVTTTPKPIGGPRNVPPKEGRLPRDSMKGPRDKFVGDRDRFRKNRTLKEMEFREDRERRREREMHLRSPK